MTLVFSHKFMRYSQTGRIYTHTYVNRHKGSSESNSLLSIILSQQSNCKSLWCDLIKKKDKQRVNKETYPTAAKEVKDDHLPVGKAAKVYNINFMTFQR